VPLRCFDCGCSTGLGSEVKEVGGKVPGAAAGPADLHDLRALAALSAVIIVADDAVEQDATRCAMGQAQGM